MNDKKKFLIQFSISSVVGLLIFLAKNTHAMGQQEILDMKKNSIESEVRFFCFYSVMLPADFIPSGMFFRIHGVEMTKIDTKRQYYYSFKQFLERYEGQLRNTSTIDPLDEPYVKNIYQLVGGNGMIFERNAEPFTPDMARVLDAWKWDDDVTFSVQMKARDERSPRYDIYKNITQNKFRYTVLEKKSKITLIINGLHARKDSQPPKNNNLAIQYGEIDVYLLGEFEIGVNYENKNHVRLNFSTDNSGYISEPLLDIDKNVMAIQSGETLYSRRRQINGLDVSEWLLRKKTLQTTFQTIDYEFYLSVDEKGDKTGQPLNLIMRYSVDANKSSEYLTEHELIHLWGSIIDTIKFSPPHV